MIKRGLTKCLSLLLALTVIFSNFFSLGAVTAYAAVGEKADITFRARPILKVCISAEINSARISLWILTAELRIKQHPISSFSVTAVKEKAIC